MRHAMSKELARKTEERVIITITKEKQPKGEVNDKSGILRRYQKEMEEFQKRKTKPQIQSCGKQCEIQGADHERLCP